MKTAPIHIACFRRIICLFLFTLRNVHWHVCVYVCVSVVMFQLYTRRHLNINKFSLITSEIGFTHHIQDRHY